MKRSFTILLLLIVLGAHAQFKSSSIGLRMGGLSGISFKYIDDDLSGFELIAGCRDGGLNLTGLIQHYRPIATGRTDGLFLFMGGGAHAGYTRYSAQFVRVIDNAYYYTYHQHTSPVAGGDFILGMEYHFESIPLHLGLDYKPYFELFGQKDFRLDLWDIGFSIRYAFNQ